jgi:hypothetical protein
MGIKFPKLSPIYISRKANEKMLSEILRTDGFARRRE